MAGGDAWIEDLSRRHRPWDATVGCLLAALAWVVLRPPVRINHDAAMLLDIGRSWWEGARPYVDYVETNPPFVHALFALPAGLSVWLGTTAGPTYQASVALLVMGSVAATRAILNRAGFDPAGRGLVLIALVSHALVVAAAGDFGQKEHLWFVLALPWFVLMAVGGINGPTAFAVGVAAAVGSQIKPHFVVVGLAYVLGLAGVRRRARELARPEVLGFAAGGCAYPLLLMALPAESREAMRGYWWPFVARGYAVYDSPWCDVIGLSLVPFSMYAVAAVAAWTGRVERRLTAPLIALLVLSATAYLAQHKAFVYQRVGTLGFAAVLAAAGVRGWSTSERPLAFSAWFLAVLGGVALVVRGAVTDPIRDPLFEVIARHARSGDRVLFVDTAVKPEWPAMLEYGFRPAGRYRPAFPIAILYAGTVVAPDRPPPYRSLEEAGPEERRFFAELEQDVEQWQPSVVVVADAGDCMACPPGFDVLGLLEHNGFRAHALAGYHQVAEVDGKIVFAVRPEEGDAGE